MLQFLIGTTTIALDWLTEPLMGTTVYNSPPLFFIALPVLLFTGFYRFHIRREIFVFLLVISILGIGSAYFHGFTEYHRRQILAFGVSAIIWIFLYQTAAKRDIFTMANTRAILGLYFVMMVLILTERYVFEDGNIAYFIGSIFSNHPSWLYDYAVGSNPPRLSYFSVEPSSAACAIAGSLMPLVCARAAAEKSGGAYAMFFLAAIVLYFAEGLTSQIILAFSLGFIFFPRLATYGVPCVLGAAATVAISMAKLITDRAALIDFLLQTFGGIYSRIDAGFVSGSYISRLGTYFIGARTFADAPIFGQGFGGSGANFFNLANQGLDVLFTNEQQTFLTGENNVYNAQMILRIPAELGIVGTAFILWYCWKGFKLAGRARAGLPKFDYYTYLFSAGVMMVTFITNGEYALPTISAFVVILAQTRRKLGELQPFPAKRTATGGLAPSQLPATA